MINDIDSYDHNFKNVLLKPQNMEKKKLREADLVCNQWNIQFTDENADKAIWMTLIALSLIIVDV